jgi:CobQ/CobB/MinD/ParA nucleotide binding domain
MTVRFDDSLPILVRLVVRELGEPALTSGVALRDATGRLAFFSDAELSEDIRSRVTHILRSELGPYAREDRVIAGKDDFGAAKVLSDPSAIVVSVKEMKKDDVEVIGRVRLLDRRLVGADWLRAPVPAAQPPPRFVFASLKGGVGRSTALCVAAAEFAAKGRRVLAIDLDMEAPGIGAMLLDDGTLPEFGLVDALVENGLAPLDETFLADLIGPSALADRRGRIDVMPAFGRRSIQNPGEFLPKYPERTQKTLA